MAAFTQKSEDSLTAVADRLVARYAGQDRSRSELIRRSVETEAGRFENASVHAFVPILVERAVRAKIDTAVLASA